MKLAQFTSPSLEGSRIGILVDNRIVDLAMLAAAVKDSGAQTPAWLLSVGTINQIIARIPGSLSDIETVLANAHTKGLAQDQRTTFAEDSITFLPAVYPGKILAIGRNYVDHAIEGGQEPPTAPLIFNKLSNSLSAHDAPIVLPTISTQVDYEAELAVVIGRRAKRVKEEEALNHVFGYAPINDVSARDLQFGDGQWVRGKGLDGFAPIGPFITTRDEIRDVHSLKIEGRLNGQVMQSSNTAKMIFKVPFLVSYISQGITLEPGDVIATGTPEGVGIFRKPPVLLKAGDVFEVAIEGIGTLRNKVQAEGGE
ncbi:MAG TPA: fumarylacetoacetate hydrolase family protein [Blastocatellia bacterium]|nr:fumarylacetoacetate hydrolase family protein [Blastocatellia bacterium]